MKVNSCHIPHGFPHHGLTLGILSVHIFSISLVSVPIFRFILSALRLSFFHLQIMEPSECSE